MQYFLDEKQKMIQNLARSFVNEKIIPVRAELDEKEEFPWDIVKGLADADMFRLFVPEEYGGLGGGCLDFCLIVEELSRGCGGVAISYVGNAVGSYPLLDYGSEEQKREYLPDIASGKKLAAFA
ncbi:acyl-CoA dehydrogenase family protein, partial [Chloroflexota bacterium]